MSRNTEHATDRAPQAFPQPALVVNHPLRAHESPNFLPTADRVLDLASAGYRLEVPGTEHLTFTDAPLWLPPVPSVVGTLGPYEGPTLTAEVTALFLDHKMLGKGSETQLREELSLWGSLDHTTTNTAGR